MSTRTAIIFGCGYIFENKKNTLRDEFEILGVTDNDCEKWGKKVNIKGRDYSIRNPKDVFKKYKSSIFIVASNDVYNVVDQLKKNGIPEYNIQFAQNFLGNDYDRALYNKDSYLFISNGVIIYRHNKRDYRFYTKEELIKFQKKILEKRIIENHKLTFHDYLDVSLSYPRPKSVSKCWENDIYGHEAILKRYVEMDNGEYIHATVEHGLNFIDYMYKSEIQANMPAIIVMSSWRRRTLERCTKKPVFDIGPYIAYVDDTDRIGEIKKDKLLIGKNLLVFPVHSTDIGNLSFDVDEFIREIKRISINYDTVRVCLYWKDVLLGRDKEYLAQGWEVVSAGFTFEENFLLRQKMMIRNANMIISNGFGTYVSYAVYMGVPVYLFRQGLSEEVDSQDVINDDSNKEKNVIETNAYKVFGVPNDKIAENQIKYGMEYLGINSVKTQVELKKIFKECENNGRVSISRMSGDRYV